MTRQSLNKSVRGSPNHDARKQYLDLDGTAGGIVLHREDVDRVDRQRFRVNDMGEGGVEWGEGRLPRDETRVDEGGPVHRDGEHGAPGVRLLHHHTRKWGSTALAHEDLTGVCKEWETRKRVVVRGSHVCIEQKLSGDMVTSELKGHG